MLESRVGFICHWILPVLAYLASFLLLHCYGDVQTILGSRHACVPFHSSLVEQQMREQLCREIWRNCLIKVEACVHPALQETRKWKDGEWGNDKNSWWPQFTKGVSSQGAPQPAAVRGDEMANVPRAHAGEAGS